MNILPCFVALVAERKSQKAMEFVLVAALTLLPLGHGLQTVPIPGGVTPCQWHSQVYKDRLNDLND